jgi:hypothetical protein
MKRTLRRPSAEPDLNLPGLRRMVDGWYAVKQQTSMLTAKLNEEKKALQSAVHKYGQTDPSNGNIFLDLEEPVGDRRIFRLKSQAATVPGFNEEAAEEILRAKGIWDDMIEMVPVLDQSRVHAAFYDNKITEDELAIMFPKRTQYTFVLLDDNDKPVY